MPKKEKIMHEYKIKVSTELAETLLKAAGGKNMTAEQFILQILNKYLIPPHTIDQEAMARGYEDMGEINIELSK